jgi:hypothetical protein
MFWIRSGLKVWSVVHIMYDHNSLLHRWVLDVVSISIVVVDSVYGSKL